MPEFRYLNAGTGNIFTWINLDIIHQNFIDYKNTGIGDI